MELDEQIVTAVRNSSNRSVIMIMMMMMMIVMVMVIMTPSRSLSLVNDEIRALEAEIEPPPGTFQHKEEADFWLELPRTFSFTSARLDMMKCERL